jgi:hypothetical protein
MSLKFRMLVTTLALICVNAASANADICFRYGSGGGTLVAKAPTTLPAAQTCEAFGFFENGGLWGAATGSICTDRHLEAIFHYTYDGCANHYFESGTCRFGLTHGNLPSAWSSCRGTANQSGFSDDTATLEFCDGIPVPHTGPGGEAYSCTRTPFRHPKVDQ